MDVATIQWDKLEQLRALQKPGRPDVVAQLIATYIANSNDLIAKIGESLAAGDAENFKRAAHSLKSTSASIGANALSAIAAQIEAMARAGQMEATTSLVKQAQVAHGAVITQLGQHYPRVA